jgi:hypothetical protein
MAAILPESFLIRLLGYYQGFKYRKAIKSRKVDRKINRR